MFEGSSLKVLGGQGGKKDALAGSRTRIYCLEGNNANRYTTNACLERSAKSAAFKEQLRGQGLRSCRLGTFREGKQRRQSMKPFTASGPLPSYIQALTYISPIVIVSVLIKGLVQWPEEVGHVPYCITSLTHVAHCSCRFLQPASASPYVVSK